MQNKSVKMSKGKLETRGSKTWHANLFFKGERYRFSTGKSNLNEAIEIYNNFLNNLENPQEKKADFSFSELCLEFLKDKKASPKISNGTFEKYQNLTKLLLPFFKNRYVSEINRILIKEYYDYRMRNGDSPEHIKEELSFLSNIFNHALDMEIYDKNPITGWKFYEDLPNRKPRLRVLTPDEALKLIKNANKTLKRLLIFLLETGMRIGETLKLTHNDILIKEIKYKNKLFKVPCIFIRAEITKTKKSRIIPLTPLAHEQINQQKIDFPNQIFIFTDPKGNAYKTRPRKALCNAFIKSKIEPAGFHIFRHTFGDWKLQGVNLCGVIKQKELGIISKMLGHSSIKTTEKFYAHHNIDSIIRGFIELDEDDDEEVDD